MGDPVHGLIEQVELFLRHLDAGTGTPEGRKRLDLALAKTKRMLRSVPISTDRQVRWVDGEPETTRRT
jgi:hypothetical protein